MKITAKYRNNTTVIEIENIADVELTSGQKERAEAFGAEYVFVTGDCRDLPKYVHEALINKGLDYTKIGHTSYKHATWGAKVVA